MHKKYKNYKRQGIMNHSYPCSYGNASQRGDTQNNSSPSGVYSQESSNQFAVPSFITPGSLWGHDYKVYDFIEIPDNIARQLQARGLLKLTQLDKFFNRWAR